MKCPKCSTQTELREVKEYLPSSGVWIDVFKCINCSYLREVEIVPVVTRQVELVPAKGRPSDKPETTRAYLAVQQFFDSIVMRLKEGASWQAIAKILKVATGHKVIATKVEKYFLLEQSRRGMSGQTAT